MKDEEDILKLIVRRTLQEYNRLMVIAIGGLAFLLWLVKTLFFGGGE